MSAVSKVAKNTTVLLIAQIISYALAFFYTIYTARYLGASGFGIISSALALGAILSIFTELGLSTLTIREVSRDKTLANKYIGNTLALKLILSTITITAMVLLVTLGHYPPQIAAVIYYITLSFVVGAFTSIFYSIFQAYEKMEFQSIGQIINSIIMFSGILLIIYYQKSIIEFGLIYLIASIISLIYGFIICVWKFVLPKIEIDLNLWRSALTNIEIDTNLWKFLISEAVPLAISGIFLLIAFKIDTLLLLYFNGTAPAGFYNAAYGLMAALMFVPFAYVSAIFPLLSRLNVSSKELLKYSYEKSFKYLLILGLPIAVGTTLLASPIILLLYKSGFSQSINALQILIWAIPLIFINYILGTAINSINKQRETVKTTFIVMILNIVLNVLLLPRYGLIAACYITVLTELTCFMLWYHIMNLNGYKFNILKLVYKPFIASLVMALAIILLHTNLFIVIILATIIYFAALYFLKTFTEDDISLIKRVIGRT
ncbi:MAG: flippase [Methanobacterium sp.]|uniref:flippase n=1 Tax=Methanobacterium sp. TaxID=2164 RepID=UPI003C762507